MQIRELRQPRKNAPKRGRGRHCHAQDASKLTCASRGVISLIKRGKDRLGPDEIVRSSLGKRHFDLLLKGGDDARGGRLRHAHFAPGNGEAAGPSDAGEELQREERSFI